MPARRCERAKCCERSRRDRNLQVAICRVVLRPADDAQKLAPPPCTAIGSGALLSNVGAQNTATGSQALLSNTTGSENTADGYQALLAATTGADNTGIGRQALLSNMTGSGNTAIGLDVLADNTAGSNNIAVGIGAGVSLATGDNNIDIGNAGGGSESDTIRIGDSQTRAFIPGITGVPVTETAVVLNIFGQLGVAPSSQRFKEDIKPIDKASESLLRLKPVTFRYKKEIDPAGSPQFGLVAEDVEKINPDLVVRDTEGKPYSRRYDQVNAMLLSEFLEEQRQVEEQQAAITELKSTVAQQQTSFQSKLAEQEKQIEALASGLQKMTAQVEMSQLTRKVVSNEP